MKKIILNPFFISAICVALGTISVHLQEPPYSYINEMGALKSSYFVSFGFFNENDTLRNSYFLPFGFSILIAGVLLAIFGLIKWVLALPVKIKKIILNPFFISAICVALGMLSLYLEGRFYNYIDENDTLRNSYLMPFGFLLIIVGILLTVFGVVKQIFTLYFRKSKT